MTAFKYQTCAPPPATGTCWCGAEEDWGFATVLYFQFLIRGRWRQFRRIRSKKSGVTVVHVLRKVET